MPSNLILNKGASSDIAIELLRGTGADWKILSSNGNLAIQCDYFDQNTEKSYYSVISMAYNTGNITTRGSIIPATNNAKQLGSASSKWQYLYSTNAYVDIVQNSNGGIINFTSDSKSIGTSTNPWSNLYNTNVYLDIAQNSSGGIIDFTSNKNIGSSSNPWNNLYITNIEISGYLNFNSTAKFLYNSADRCIDVIFN